jgi:hypothetical protein
MSVPRISFSPSGTVVVQINSSADECEANALPAWQRLAAAATNRPAVLAIVAQYGLHPIPAMRRFQ